MAELLREAAAACAAEAIAESRVGGKLRESSGHGFHVARWDEKACLARDADFSRAIDVVAHDRLAGDECLRERAGESFAKACVDEQVHRSEQLGNFRRWNEPRELKCTPLVGRYFLVPSDTSGPCKLDTHARYDGSGRILNRSANSSKTTRLRHRGRRGALKDEGQDRHPNDLFR